MLSQPIIITFAIYIVGMLLIGGLGYRATKNFSDYILGGRKLNSFVTALAAGASDMSGWLLMGLPGAIFLRGIAEVWIAIGLLIGAYLNWRFIAARLRVYTEKAGNALTLPDYFSQRFDDKSHLLRSVSAVVILVFFTLYAASGVVAGARLFESTFGCSYQTAIWIGTFCTILYVFIGGFLAVSWTDTVQATLMLLALILVPTMVIYQLGGIKASINAVALIDATHLGLMHHLDLVAIISLLAWGLGYFGQPHILVRFMAAQSVRSIPNARRIGMGWMFLCLAGAIAVGFFAIAYFAVHPEQAASVMANPERVFIEASIHLFNPWVTGILLAAILAAVMSTLSAQLLVCASSLTQDLYFVFLRKQASQRELIGFSRAMVLVIAFIAMQLASNPESRVLNMVSYAWAGFGAAFGPIILWSLVWSRMTRNGALVGMVTGALTVLIWKQYAWWKLYEIVPGFIFSSLAIIIFSLLERAPAAHIRATFEEVNHAVHGTKSAVKAKINDEIY